MVAKAEHKKRSGCPIACSLDVIGDHWTLLIIRNLLFLGQHEYKEMLANEEKISSSILSDRLKSLESDGLLASIPHPESQKRKLYYLTPMGKNLIHLMVEMVLWANVHLSDYLQIPQDKKQLLETAPDQFKELVLQQLTDWERQYLD